MADIDLLQIAKSLQVKTIGGIAQEKGQHWPPPPTISLRSSLVCQQNAPWINYEQTHSIVASSICTPASVADLVAVIRWAEVNQKRVHAFGSKWSFSDCAMTPDVMLDTGQLNNELNTVQSAFNGSQPSHVYHVQAGISIHQLYKNLDGLGLALETMGGASGQTLGGAISTGTHGGDLFTAPLADSVLAIHLVGAGGSQYWIEPTAAITDKSLLHQLVVPDIALENIIYDDDWFNAVLVSVGCMGIIYAVVLRVRSQYTLIETTSATTWQDFKQTEAQQLNDRTFRFLQVVVNPYTANTGTNFALVTTRREGDIAGLPNVTSPSDRVIHALLQLAGDLLTANPIDAVKVAAETFEQLLQSGNINDIFNSAGKVLVQLINNILSDAPELRAVVENDYSNFMAALWAPGTIGDVSYKVMDATRYRPAFGPIDVDSPNIDPTGGYSFEVSLPAQLTGGTPPIPYYVGFVDDLIKMVNNATGTFLLGYVAIRFMGQSRAFLGMQQWAQTCSVEVSALPGVNAELELLTNILDQIYYYPIDMLPLPHWGQFLDLNRQGYGNRYPYYNKWQQIYANLSNNFTVRTFENDLSNRWQLTFPPLFMNVDVQLLGRSGHQLTIQLAVTDTATGNPVDGAAVIIYDEDFQPPVQKSSGTTGTNGIVQLSYIECLDPETHTPVECSGRVRKERYQDVYFFTPK